jgi:hypothetical protein
MREMDLQIFDMTGIVLEQIKEKYMPLIIAGIEDSEGYKAVHEARMNVKNTRVKVEKRGAELRKALRAKIEKDVKDVSDKEKYILGELQPVEEHLTAQEKAVDDEKARIKREAEEAEAARIQTRITRLFDLGCRFDSTKYSYDDLIIFALEVKTCKDEAFNAFVARVEAKVKEAEEAKAAEEAKLREEETRLAKEAEKQRLERVRLADAAKEQEEREAKMKAEAAERERKAREELEEREKKLREEREAAEREVKLKAAAEEKRLAEERAKLEAEKKELQDKKDAEEAEKKRLADLEKAKAEAAEKARLEAEEKAKRDAEAKVVAERLAKEEAERQEALRPDKEKLLLFASSIELLPAPEVATEDGQAVLSAVEIDLAGVVRRLRKKVEGL